jgi:2-polyprenyl-6-methoxyphenol hydroxylase-like FAD-dependent oxidoreductase
MGNKDALICGASIAGPALAYWLRRAGYNPTVVERAPAPRPGGQAVDLRGAGRTVIDRMGLMATARSVSLDQRGLAIVKESGRITVRMPTDSFGGEGMVSEIEILRGDLCQLMYEATRADTEYLFDDTITALEQDDDGVRVTFEKAAPRTFGLVFGADGLHSVVRALTFGPETSYVRPLDCYTAWFTSTDEYDLDDWYMMFNAPGARVASARPGSKPGETKVALAFRADGFTYDRRDVAGQRKALADRFAGLGWEVPRLVDAMRTADDFFFDSMGQVHLEHWSRGRVAVLGDAGYCPTPLTGLGTSLALVGSYVLAGELAAAGGDHAVGFKRYEEVMRPYVTKAQELPPGGAKGFAPGSTLSI